MYTAEQLERELNQTNFPMERYKPIEKLGGSAVSDSYLCYDEFLEEEVVVKKLGVLEFDELIHFQREATALCRIRNKNLAQVVDFGATADGAVYLVYEYHAGISIKLHLRGSGSEANAEQSLVLSPELAYRAFIPVAEAIAAMHSQGILHRDIKASNILLRNLEAQDSAVFLIDSGSGIVRHATAQQISFEGRTVTGDPNYLAPEQLLLQQYDARSEIFALGCVFFEALTGRTPFSGDDVLSHLARRSPPSLSQVSDGLTYNYKIEGFVRRCLERNPDARYKSMQEVLHALKDLVKNKVSIDRHYEANSSSSGMSFAEAERERARTRRANFKSTGNKLKLLAPDDERLDTNSPRNQLTNSSQPPEQAETTPGKPSELIEKKQERVSKIADSVTPPRVHVVETSVLKQTPAVRNSPNTATVSSGTKSTPSDNESKDFRSYVARARQMASWVTTTRQGMIALVIVSTTIVCGWLTFSYVEYLVAPRSEEDGLVYAYQPATKSKPGQLTLGVETTRPGITYLSNGKPRGLLEKHHIVIESPSENLPYIESGPGFANELHDTTLFDRDSLNLTSMRSGRDPEEESESDLRLGETWRVKIRTQNGTRFLESVKNGSAYLINPELQDIHIVITKMYRALIAQSRNHDNQYAYINPEWAASNFNTSVRLTPPPLPMARPFLFPAQDIKLKNFDSHCEVLLKAPSWMTGVGFLDVTLRVERDGWKIMDIAPATQAEWDQL